MGWITLLLALLPLLLKLLGGLGKASPEQLARMPERTRVKLGQLRTACQNYESQCSRLGVSPVPLDVEGEVYESGEPIL